MDENTIMMIVWLSVFVIAVIAEFLTTDLVSIWVCIGALIALAVTYIPGMPWWGEVIVFLVATVISLIALRPVLNRVLVRKQSKTNIDTIIGKKGKVIKDITNLEKGLVEIDHMTWTACLCPEAADIVTGSVVEVVSVEGNKLFVKELTKEN